MGFVYRDVGVQKPCKLFCLRKPKFLNFAQILPKLDTLAFFFFWGGGGAGHSAPLSDTPMLTIDISIISQNLES